MKEWTKEIEINAPMDKIWDMKQAIFKLFLWFAGDKVVVKFVERVKELAEAESALVK